MRIRIFAGQRMIGPGKMELLAHLDATGSLAAAAKEMGMSYMRAWKLVQDMNRDPKRPMVATVRGGPQGGAGKLTPRGKKILELYQQMDRAGTTAARPFARKLARLLQ